MKLNISGVTTLGTFLYHLMLVAANGKHIKDFIPPGYRYCEVIRLDLSRENLSKKPSRC